MYIKEWLANQTHVATSVFHLGRYCDDWKASTYPTGMPRCGYTPNELVTRLRINIAINLLRRGYKVEEVTSRVGYESLSGFNKAFRKITSSTPADFWKAR